MNVFFRDPDMTLLHGDAVEQLRTLPDESVHCVVTSPPFFGLRDYGADGQIGLEASSQDWAAALVAVFEECRRVLRSDGTLWVECGDSYAASQTSDRRWCQPTGDAGKLATGRAPQMIGKRTATDLTKPKDLIGAPWLLAFALRDAGWWLRGAYPWIKRNAMPESVRDRFTICSSTVFQFAKSSRYFFDGVAVSEQAEWARWGDQTTPKHNGTETASGWIPTKTKHDLIRGHDKDRSGFHERWRNGSPTASRWPRGWFDIPTEPNGLALCEQCGAYWERGAPAQHCGVPVTQHYAAFPQALVERIVKCSTSERGVCGECGAPWVRETERVEGDDQSWSQRERPTFKESGLVQSGQRGGHGNLNRGSKDDYYANSAKTKTIGWRPSCGHDGPAVPAVVLDPFAGSGTTLLVSRRLGRHAVGVELREAYCRMVERRLAQLTLGAIT